MALPTRRAFDSWDRRQLPSRYGVLTCIVPGDHTVPVEVERAPDSGGSPGTYVAIHSGTYPKSGGFFFDPLPNDNATRWYRARHGVGEVYGTAGAYFTAFSATPRLWREDVMFSQQIAVAPFSRTEDLKDLGVTVGKLSYSGATITISNVFFDDAANEVDLSWSSSGMPSGVKFNVSIWQQGSDGIYKAENDKTSTHTFTGITGATGAGTVRVDAEKDGVLIASKHQSGTWAV